MPEEGKDLVKKLLMKDPQDRLSISEVKNHQFFEDYDFEKALGSESPLCSLYCKIQENQIELCSSDSDSFINENSFDQNFEEPTMEENDTYLYEDETKKKHNRRRQNNFFQKSSSLGEKCIQELISIENELKESNKCQISNFSQTSEEDKHCSKSEINNCKDHLSQTTSVCENMKPSTPELKPRDYSFQPEKKNVVLEGYIKKITAWIIYKRRYLELSYTDDVPRLIYYTANKKAFRNEIILTKRTKVYTTGQSKFEISDGTNTFYFKDCNDTIKIKQWVNAINKAISSIAHKNTDFKPEPDSRS